MKIGLALSGGGVKGAAHIGVLRALEEAGIKIDVIAGTSAGGIVAMLYSIGYTPDEIAEIFVSLNIKDLLDFDRLGMAKSVLQVIFGKEITLDGLVKGNKIKKLLSYYCNAKGKTQMQDSLIPLAIPAVDINTAQTKMFVSDTRGLVNDAETEYICNATLADAVRASIAFPAIFQPNIYNGSVLCDGGINDNLPLNILRQMGADKSLGVMLGYSGQCRYDVDNLLEIAGQSVNILSYRNVKNTVRTNKAYIINPHIYDVKLLDFAKIEECIERGYSETIKLLPYILGFVR